MKPVYCDTISTNDKKNGHILRSQQNKQYVFNCINALNTGRMGQAHIKTFENVKANIFIVIR